MATDSFKSLFTTLVQRYTASMPVDACSIYGNAIFTVLGFFDVKQQNLNAVVKLNQLAREFHKLAPETPVTTA